MDFNVVLMSPPCQPFTRVGLKKDADDRRTGAFFILLENFKRMKTPPAYIFVENVKGFEDSATHDIFIQHLQDSGYIYQEFLLTPLQFGIPNSRLRYYCMAKRKQMGEFVFSTVDTPVTEIPPTALSHLLPEHSSGLVDLPSERSSLNEEQLTEVLDSNKAIRQLRDYLTTDTIEEYILDEKTMQYYDGLDIRTINSRNSCCFTKRYGHYHVGSGSLLATGNKRADGKPELRHFTPREISQLMCFPPGFDFPGQITRKQRYRALGNSLNVQVVANLIKLMMELPKT